MYCICTEIGRKGRGRKGKGGKGREMDGSGGKVRRKKIKGKERGRREGKD